MRKKFQTIVCYCAKDEDKYPEESLGAPSPSHKKGSRKAYVCSV